MKRADEFNLYKHVDHWDAKDWNNVFSNAGGGSYKGRPLAESS